MPPGQALPTDTAPAKPSVGRLMRLSTAEAIGMTRILAGTVLTVATATFLAWMIFGMASMPNLDMLFIPAILYCAISWGLTSALIASVLSVLSYNFFFMEPFGAFGIRGIDDALAVTIFIAIGAVTSDLASKVRGQVAAAREREAHASALLDLSRTMEGADSAAALARCLVEAIGARLAAPAAVWEPAGRGAWTLLAASDERIAGRMPDRTDTAAAGDDEPLRFPMRAGAEQCGVLVVPAPPDRAATALLQALADAAGDALRRVRMKRELEEARRVAETERLASALLNSISHDLRTPLSTILGATTTLTMPGQAFSDAARDQLLGTIRDEAFRLDRFVRNLLDMSQLEGGVLRPKLDWLELPDVIRATTQRIKPAPKSVVLAIEANLPMLRLDPVLTEHALVNVLENAVKYSPPQGQIRVTARRTGDKVAIGVEDEGPGIPAAEREAVFEKFRRLRSGDRSPAGTGLGLSIARGFVEAQGGSMHAEAGDRGGARFVIEFPVRADAPVV